MDSCRELFENQAGANLPSNNNFELISNGIHQILNEQDTFATQWDTADFQHFITYAHANISKTSLIFIHRLSTFLHRIFEDVVISMPRIDLFDTSGYLHTVRNRMAARDTKTEVSLT